MTVYGGDGAASDQEMVTRPVTVRGISFTETAMFVGALKETGKNIPKRNMRRGIPPESRDADGGGETEGVFCERNYQREKRLPIEA